MSTPLLDNSVAPSEATVLHWIEAAAKAPSPDNNQPWLFRVRENAVEVYLDPVKALPSDVNGLFSWIALGAAIENLVLAASVDGWQADVEYQSRPFRTDAGAEHVATVTFKPDGRPDPLAEWIDDRVTNRKPYRREPIPEADLQALAGVLRSESDRVAWLTDRHQLKQLARMVRITDRIRFEHQPFHDEFHKVLRYGEEHACATGDGLELKTLELPPLAGPLLRCLRPWKRMEFANYLGMSRIFAETSAKQVLHSAAAGLLTTTEGCRPKTEDCRAELRTAVPPSAFSLQPSAFLEAGRSFQRIWLAATQAGLSFQPMGGLPLFLTKLAEQGSETFQPNHAEQMQTVAAAYHELFSEVADRAPVMLFRIGHSAPPSARSIRFPVERILLPQTGSNKECES